MKGRVYRRPDPTLATGRFREFKPRISCLHLWERNVASVTLEGVGTFYQILPGERCAICEATCLRDENFRIVEYSTKAERELEEEERRARVEVAA